MASKPWVRWILGLVGAILIGAVGSGVWQNILSPASNWLIRGILNIGSLGLDAYRDSLYRDIAANNDQAVALTLLGLGALVLAFSLGYFSSGLWDLARRVETSSLPAGGPPTPTSIRVFAVATQLVMIAFLAFVIVSTTRASYVSRAQAYVRQSIAILTPSIGSPARLELEARFYRISSRRDFIVLQAKMDSLATSANTRIPSFATW